jgi:hypothetical protein
VGEELVLRRLRAASPFIAAINQRWPERRDDEVFAEFGGEDDAFVPDRGEVAKNSTPGWPR